MEENKLIDELSKAEPEAEVVTTARNGFSEISAALDFPPLKKELQLSPEMKRMIDNPIRATEEQLQDSRIVALLDESVL